MSNLVYFPTGQVFPSDEKLFLTLSECITWTADACGMVTEIDYMWEVLTGQSVRECRGWGWLELIHPEDRERVSREWCRSISTGQKYQNFERVKLRGDIYRCMQTFANPLFNAEGRIVQWYGYSTLKAKQEGEVISLDRRKSAS